MTSAERPVINPEQVKDYDSTHPPRSHESQEIGDLRLDIASANIDRGEIGVGSQDCSLVSDRLFGVFDGMGGHTGGTEASSIAASSVEKVFSKFSQTTDPEAQRKQAENSLVAADSAIRRAEQESPELSGMGTTGTIVRIFTSEDNSTYVSYASVGDSSLLMMRSGEVRTLTTEECSPAAPRVVSNALGAGDAFKGVDREKNSGVFKIEEGDRLVLVTDGILGDFEKERLSEAEYAAALDTGHDALEAIEKLIEASKKVDDKGVVVVDIKSTKDKAPGGEKKKSSDGSNPKRSRGAGMNQRHNRKRASTDPKKVRTKTKTKKVSKAEKDEHWDKEKYLAENIDLYNDDSDLGKELIASRSMLADAVTAARSGRLISNRKSQRQLEAARSRYETAKEAYFSYHLDAAGDKSSADQRRELLALIDSQERGVLMGEEAYAYLETTEHTTRFDKLVKKYNDLPRAGKIVAGIGAAATTAALAGLTAGGAAAGVALSGRFGRKYFSEEARRRVGSDATLRERQEASTLRQGNYEDYKNTKTELRNSKSTKPFERVDSVLVAGLGNVSASLDNETSSRVDSERESETSSKRKALGKAAIFGAAGAGAGYILANATGLHGGIKEWFGDPDPEDVDVPPTDPDILEQQRRELDDLKSRLDEQAERGADLDEQLEQEQERLEELQERQRELEERQRALQADGEVDADEDIEPEVSERSQYLYGELAGVEVDITIPEGSNVWSQLESVVEQEMPNIPNDEKQRMVGNILNQLEQEYPGRDLNLVYPGEEFNVKLPS